MPLTIALCRGLLGWSQAELAARAGTSQSNIRDLELGRNRDPAYSLLTRIVAAFQAGGLVGLTPEKLGYGVPTPAGGAP